MTRGLKPSDSTSLETALTTLEADMADSDGDGTADVAELRDSRNPNRPDAPAMPDDPKASLVFETKPDRTFGCAATSPTMRLALLMGLTYLTRHGRHVTRRRRADGR